METGWEFGRIGDILCVDFFVLHHHVRAVNGIFFVGVHLYFNLDIICEPHVLWFASRVFDVSGKRVDHEESLVELPVIAWLVAKFARLIENDRNID